MQAELFADRLELFPDPGPADAEALVRMAASAIPRTVLSATSCSLAKSTELFPHGYSLSLWFNPFTKEQVWEYNPRQLPGQARNNLPRLTATTYEQQVDIHRALGARVLPRGA